MLSETHVDDAVNTRDLNIPGYALVICESNSRHTGGVAMYVKDEINYKVIFNKSKSRTWILTIQVIDSLINGRYSVLYKSPKEKINDFLSIFDEFCEEMISDEHKNILVGDFNIDVSKNYKNTKLYLSCVKEHNLMQLVNEPTRVNTKKLSATIIDHILTNSNDITYKINKEDTVTDHFMIELKMNQRVKSDNKKNQK